MIEIAIFLGEGFAGEGNQFGYREGEKHGLLAFLRQHRGSTLNFETAEMEMESLGWKQVNFYRASTLTNVEALNAMHNSAAASYEDALNNGFAAIVYADPIE